MISQSFVPYNTHVTLICLKASPASILVMYSTSKYCRRNKVFQETVTHPFPAKRKKKRKILSCSMIQPTELKSQVKTPQCNSTRQAYSQFNYINAIK